MKGSLAAAVVAALSMAAAPAALGNTVAFNAGLTQISGVPSTGGAPSTLIGAGALAAWSPNGKQLAYIANNAVYVAKANGSGAKRIARLPAAPAGTGTPAGELPHGGPPAWSPNGKQLAYANGGTIRIVNATGGKAKTIVNPNSGGGFYGPAGHPVWSANGKRVYYLTIQQDVGDAFDVWMLQSQKLSLRASENAPWINITFPTPGYALTGETLSLSPDGTTIAVTAQQQAGQGGGYAVALVPVAGNRTAALLPGFRAAAYAPGGQQLCANDAAGNLDVIDTSGNLVTTLVTPAAGSTATACAWQPGS